MKCPVRVTLMLCLYLFCMGCSPRLVRPVVDKMPEGTYLEYQAELSFHPETTLHVTLRIPPNTAACDSFCFPSQVPGSYCITKFGKFIDQLNAYDSQGSIITHIKVDSSLYRIERSRPVDRISYHVRPTSDYQIDSVPLFSGTRLKSNHCILNPYAIFGFFPNLKDMPIRVRLSLPAEWQIGTSLEVDSAGYFHARSYYDLQDNPIIAGNLSRYAFRDKRKGYFVYVFSDASEITARSLKRIVKRSVRDADAFLEGRIGPDYSFLFTFLNDTLTVAGAHEHTKSSLYCFSAGSFQDLKSSLGGIVRHELFHTLLPLRLRGDEVNELDFVNIHTVSHLWFYEGLAQWAAFKMQLISGSITPSEYLGTFRRALVYSDTKTDSLDFLNLSRSVLESKPLIADVYRRGFIFGTLLDMYIIKKTKGKMTLREVLLKMGDTYPPDHPFDSDSLFSIISSLTHSDVNVFLQNSLMLNHPPEIDEILDGLGIMYSFREVHSLVQSELGLQLIVCDDQNYLVISGIHREAQKYGFRQGDSLLTIDGDRIIPGYFARTVQELATSDPGVSYTAEVRGSDGVKRTIKASTIRYYNRHLIKIKPSDSDLRTVWLTR